jgi:hypothetical protein
MLYQLSYARGARTQPRQTTFRLSKVGRPTDQFWITTRPEPQGDSMAKKTKLTKQVAGRRYRDDLTGRFVTKKFAKKNRKTTTKELVTA